MRPRPRKLGLQSPIRDLRVEFDASNKPNTTWKVWMTANKDFTIGTFIELDSYGNIHRVTWHEDGTESIMEL
jgi:hypothetical protein